MSKLKLLFSTTGKNINGEDTDDEVNNEFKTFYEKQHNDKNINDIEHFISTIVRTMRNDGFDNLQYAWNSARVLLGVADYISQSEKDPTNKSDGLNALTYLLKKTNAIKEKFQSGLVQNLLEQLRDPKYKDSAGKIIKTIYDASSLDQKKLWAKQITAEDIIQEHNRVTRNGNPEVPEPTPLLGMFSTIYKDGGFSDRAQAKLLLDVALSKNGDSASAWLIEEYVATFITNPLTDELDKLYNNTTNRNKQTAINNLKNSIKAAETKHDESENKRTIEIEVKNVSDPRIDPMQPTFDENKDEFNEIKKLFPAGTCSLSNDKNTLTMTDFTANGKKVSRNTITFKKEQALNKSDTNLTFTNTGPADFYHEKTKSILEAEARSLGYTKGMRMPVIIKDNPQMLEVLKGSQSVAAFASDAEYNRAFARGAIKEDTKTHLPFYGEPKEVNSNNTLKN